MTDRGAAPSDRAPACPFVAFDDDRDERADRPDHRHRCYAEVRPAPRAIAHQETYCLSPRFPACPTFQDWARREAAQARGITNRTGLGRVSAADDDVATADGDGAGPADGDAAAGAAVLASGAAVGAIPDDGPLDIPDPFDDDTAPRGRPQRDWAAPPPWVGRIADTGDEPPAAPAPPGAGLATSRWLTDVKPGDTDGADESTFVTVPDPAAAPVEPVPRPELAGLVGRQRRTGRDAAERARRERPVVGQARPMSGRDRGRDRDRDRDDQTPAWERPHPFESYPSIRSRVVLPSNVPRVALGALALIVAALLVFLLPALFFSRNSPAAIATSSPSASASVSLAPTSSPKATPLTYTVKANDTLTKIANKFKTTQKAILAANPAIKNANLIAVGDVLVIPTAPPPDVITSSSGPSASPSASAP
jgi:nucleoid-associated protein YgaU